MTEVSVNQRAQQILKILVERYIKDGFPVGSKTIAEEYELGLSPATIRHILAELEEAGHLTSPHTSAGRVPTAKGYRFFVNSLLTIKPLQGDVIHDVEATLDPDLPLSSLLESASSLLSNLTNLTGVVALPRRNRIELRQVEFLPLSGNRVLVILVLNNREVENRVIYTDRPYTQNELQQAANYLNTHYAGKDLLAIRKELSVSIRHDRDDMARLLQMAVDVANKAFDQPSTPGKDCVIAGQNKLLNYSNGTDWEQLQSLFNAISQRQDILNLLDHALEADGIQIFIGQETGCEAFDHCSVVTASYAVADGQLVGGLGVIGPTRMPYERVISAVDITAKLLSAALNQS